MGSIGGAISARLVQDLALRRIGYQPERNPLTIKTLNSEISQPK